MKVEAMPLHLQLPLFDVFPFFGQKGAELKAESLRILDRERECVIQPVLWLSDGIPIGWS